VSWDAAVPTDFDAVLSGLAADLDAHV